LIEKHEPAEIRSRIIVSKNNKESLRDLQIALDQRERYQTINIYNYENNRKVLIDEIQGKFECNVFCEDCYMQFCDLSYMIENSKPLIKCPDCNFFYNS
jgi:hypothetical protein